MEQLWAGAIQFQAAAADCDGVSSGRSGNTSSQNLKYVNDDELLTSSMRGEVVSFKHGS